MNQISTIYVKKFMFSVQPKNYYLWSISTNIHILKPMSNKIIENTIKYLLHNISYQTIIHALILPYYYTILHNMHRSSTKARLKRKYLVFTNIWEKSPNPFEITKSIIISHIVYVYLRFDIVVQLGIKIHKKILSTLYAIWLRMKKLSTF